MTTIEQVARAILKSRCLDCDEYYKQFKEQSDKDAKAALQALIDSAEKDSGEWRKAVARKKELGAEVNSIDYASYMAARLKEMINQK